MANAPTTTAATHSGGFAWAATNTPNTMAEMAMPVSAEAVAGYYGDLIDGFVFDMLDEEMAEEVAPKNIIMIGSTGVGKTEIARRLARLIADFSRQRV